MGVSMKPVTLTFLITILFISTAPASDVDLLPSKRFKSVQVLPQLEAAFRTNDEKKLVSASKRLTHILIDIKWQLFNSMLGRTGKEMRPKEDIEYNLCFFQYEFEKGARNIKKTTKFDMKVDYGRIDKGIEELLQNRKCNDLKSFLASLYRRVVHQEICIFVFQEVPDALWNGAEYSRVITVKELDGAWSLFRGCYNGACDHLLPATKDFYIKNKLSASHQLDFLGYDQCLEDEPKGWMSWVWNTFRSCGKKIQRKKEDQEHLYLAQISLRLLQYAVSPDFQAVINHKIEQRIYYTSWKTTLLEVFFFSCLKCRGYWKGKPYESYIWRKIPAAKRTKLFEIEKQLDDKVIRTVGQTLKRGLGVQSLAEKRDELFKAMAAENEELQKKNTDQVRELDSLWSQLKKMYSDKLNAEGELRRVAQDNSSLKLEMEGLRKKHQESEVGGKEQQIQQLSEELTELNEAMRQQKLEIQRLINTLADKDNLSKVHHESYVRLQGEAQEKDVIIRELKSRCAAFPDEDIVKNMSRLIQQLREKISTLEPVVVTSKKRIKDQKDEIYTLNQKLMAQNAQIEYLKKNQRYLQQESTASNLTIQDSEAERYELNRALEEQAKLQQEQKKTQSKLRQDLDLAKTFLDKEETVSFLQAKPALQPGDGENELIQGLAVKIIRLQEQLNLAYTHVQQLSVWCAYLEGGWSYTVAQLQSIVVVAATEEEQKYDIFAGGELFKLTWPQIQACTKEYLREHVLPSRESRKGSMENDNNEQPPQQEEKMGL